MINDKSQTVIPGVLINLTSLAFAIGMAIPGASVAQEFALEEVVVSAQRRQESVQDVPVAVTAVSGEQLENAGIIDLGQIQYISPSANITTGTNVATTANIQIRGIGTAGSQRAFEGAVGVFVDGTFRSRPGSVLGDFLDIGGIEILRGPQGTLFGKNTSGGAVVLKSNAPVIGENSGNLHFTVGDYDEQIVKGVANIDLTDNSALRVAGVINRRDGFEENNNGDSLNNVDRRGVKVNYLVEPSDKLSVNLLADYLETDERFGATQTWIGIEGFGAVVDSLSQANGFGPINLDLDDRENNLNNMGTQVNRDRGVTLRLDYSFDNGATLQSTSSWRDWSLDQENIDADMGPADILPLDEFFAVESISQEFIFNQTLESLPFVQSADYLIGVYYYDEELDATRQVYNGSQAEIYWQAAFPAVAPVSDPVFGPIVSALLANPLAPEGLWTDELFENTDEVFAVFTHWNFNVTDNINVIAGLRYSEEEKEGGFESQFFDFPVWVGLGLGPTYDYKDSVDEEELTGTLSLQYLFNDDVMMYATYSRGHKAGGINLDLNGGGTSLLFGAIPMPPADPVYDPEYVDNIELGLKADYWNGRARTNAAAFYTEVDDLQFAGFTGISFSVNNAAKAYYHGLELENTFLLSEGLQVELGGLYLDARVNGEASGALANRQPPFTPSLRAQAAVNYERTLTENLLGFTRLSANYRGDRYLSVNDDAREDSTTVVDFRIGVRSMDEKWDVALWCRNCTDEINAMNEFGPPLQFGARVQDSEAPRQYGVTFNIRY